MQIHATLQCCRGNSVNCVLKCVGLTSVSVVFVRFYLYRSYYIQHMLKLFRKSHIYIGSLFLTSSLWVLFCFALLSRVYVYRRYMNGYVHVHVCVHVYTHVEVKSWRQMSS